MDKTEALSAAQRNLREYETEITVKSNGNLTPSQIRRLRMQGKSVEQRTEVKKVRPYSHPKILVCIYPFGRSGVTFYFFAY